MGLKSRLIPCLHAFSLPLSLLRRDKSMTITLISYCSKFHGHSGTAPSAFSMKGLEQTSFLFVRLLWKIIGNRKRFKGGCVY